MKKQNSTFGSQTLRSVALPLVSAAVLIFTGCNPNEGDKVTPKLDIASSDYGIGAAEGSEQTVTFDINAGWSTDIAYSGTSTDWLTVTPQSGEAGEDIQITMRAAENTSYNERIAIVTIDYGDEEHELTVTQAAKGMPSPIAAIDDVNAALDYYAQTLTPTSAAEIVITVTETVATGGKIVLPDNLSVQMAASITFDFSEGLTGSDTVVAIEEGTDTGYAGRVTVKMPENESAGTVEIALYSAETHIAGLFDGVKYDVAPKTLCVDQDAIVNSLTIVSGDVISAGELVDVDVEAETPVTITIAKYGEFTGKYNDPDEKSTLVMGRPVTAESSKWISAVLEYRPAPGQFINDANMGEEKQGEKIVGGKSNMNLGAFGGYVTYTFDHSVVNGDRGNNEGYDFAVCRAFSQGKPAIVQVSYDRNGNGKADDEWYEIHSTSHKDPANIKNYKMVYKNPLDAPGATAPSDIDCIANGVPEVMNFSILAKTSHKHSCWPAWIAVETIEFTGTALDATVAKNSGYGYICANNNNYTSVIGGDNDTKNSDKMNLDWAHKLDGTPANLKCIDFVRIYTASVGPIPLTVTGDNGTTIQGSLSFTPMYMATE
jgi:hypothetical protein